jgi:hypothetical protein
VRLAAAALALLLAGDPPASGPASAPAVAVHLALATRPTGSVEERARVRDLEYEVMARLAASGAGELVRDEWKDGFCRILVAAADARAAWAAIEPAVRDFRPRPGSFALVRGEGGAAERIELGR